jgi:anaerobic magnesium-protoporphyrin IX monomethyl ester cyclase
MTGGRDEAARGVPAPAVRPEGRVALVFPYVRTRAATELLFPPLGLAALAAQLRRLGIETRVFDCTFGSHEGLRTELAEWQPDIVGISAMVSLTGAALEVAGAVRADLPDALLVAGGPLPTVFPRRFIGHVDAVFRGEADLSFPAFCRDYLRRRPATLDDLDLTGYDGLFVERDGLAVDVPPVHCSEEQLRSFPVPDRRDFDHAAYQEAWAEKTGSRPTSLIVTLGCPFGCDFCSKPVFGNEVRRRDLDSVMEEIASLRDLGYDSLWIADDTFTLDAPHLEEFCRRVTPLGMLWSCLSRADRVSPEMARMMREAGCRRVYLGLESGSQETLDLMHKQTTVADGVRATQIYHDAGIEVAAFFIVGYPGETAASIEQTLDLALALPLDDLSFNVPMPLPGSRLYERLGGGDPGRDWTRENELTFVFPTDIDQAWLRRRVEETLAEAARRRAAVGAAEG